MPGSTIPKLASWFDAHPDFNAPDEVTGGILTGWAWRRSLGSVGTSLPAPSPAIGLWTSPVSFTAAFAISSRVSARRSKRLAFAVFGGSSKPVSLSDALSTCLTDFPFKALVHVDLDCRDTSVGHANSFAAPGGLSSAELGDYLMRVTERTRPLARTIASSDPDCSGSDAIAAAGVEAGRIIAQAV